VSASLLIIGCHGDPLMTAGEREPVDVGGVITSDTTWRAADSPFRIVEDLLVPDSVHWEVEAGTEILVAWNRTIDVQGEAALRGTLNNRITVRSDTGIWRGIEICGGHTSSLHSVDIMYAAVGVAIDSAAIDILDCRFLFCDSAGIRCDSAMTTSISGCEFVNSRTLNLFSPIAISIGSGNMVSVDGCTIDGFSQGIHLQGNISQATLQGNAVSNCSIGIVSNCQNGVSILDNEFRGTDTGIIIRAGSPYLEGNSFVKQDQAVRAEGNSAPTAHYNSFEIGTGLTWVHYSPVDVDASNNWWGTTDIDTIQALIFDQHDDSLAGLVEIEPILTSPIQ